MSEFSGMELDCAELRQTAIRLQKSGQHNASLDYLTTALYKEITPDILIARRFFTIIICVTFLY